MQLRAAAGVDTVTKYSYTRHIANLQKDYMTTRFTEALALAQQLVAQGATEEQALDATQVAYELDDLTMNILGDNLALFYA